MDILRANWIPLFICGLGAGISLALALAPFPFVLANLPSDDAFYYFEIARNIVGGFGPTFDGINPTNGFHPLWLAAIVPIFYFLSAAGDLAPIQGVLIFSALLNLATGLVLLAIISRYTSNAWVKAGALGFWYLNPFVQYQMLNGLETPLSVFFIALFFLTALRASELPHSSRYIMAGLAAGCMLLARLDTVFYFLGYLVYLIYRDGIRMSVRPVLISGIAATMLVAPWLLWNVANFGMVLTSSSVASTIVNHELIVQDHGESWLQTFKAAVYMTDRELRAIEPFTGIPLILTLLAGLCVGWLAFGRGRELLTIMRAAIPVELFVASGFLLNFIANATIRWTAREWYFIAINLFIAIWLAWFLDKLRQEGYMRAVVTVPLILFALCLFYIGWSKNLENSKQPQVHMYEATQWMNEHLPGDAIVGAFNTGIQGYFVDRRVINLDALVNNRALEALRKKQLWAYIEAEGIDYIADYDLYFKYRYRSFLGIPDVFDRLVLVYTEPKTNLRVYKIK